MTLNEAKKLISELQFTGALALFHTSVHFEERSTKHLRIRLHIDMPTSVPGDENTCSIDNTLDLRWSKEGNAHELSAEYLKHKLYDMLVMFLMHELREGFRHNGVWVVPAHGPYGEFLPPFKDSLKSDLL
jgi:hypothetical protein